MTELDLFYQCIPDIAEITVGLRKKTPEQQEQFKSECLKYAGGLSRSAHDFICRNRKRGEFQSGKAVWNKCRQR